MIEIDKASLIDFFETLPAKQDKEEDEFFNALHFQISSDDGVLVFDASGNFEDVYIEWKSQTEPRPIVEIALKDLKSLTIKQDKLSANPFLRAVSRNACVVDIWMKPRLRVLVRNSESQQHG